MCVCVCVCVFTQISDNVKFLKALFISVNAEICLHRVGIIGMSFLRAQKYGFLARMVEVFRK